MKIQIFMQKHIFTIAMLVVLFSLLFQILIACFLAIKIHNTERNTVSIINTLEGWEAQ
jgi:NhaP-type Na+/H+ or K+/H+ antiporter